MRRVAFCCVAIICLFSIEPTTRGDDRAAKDVPVVFLADHLLTAAGAPIEKGILIVSKGKIVAIGTKDQVTIPDGATVLSLKGKTIIPGLVDTHSHIGIYPKPAVPAHQDGNEGSGAVQAGLRALDAIWPDDPGIRMAVADRCT